MNLITAVLSNSKFERGFCINFTNNLIIFLDIGSHAKEWIVIIARVLPAPVMEFTATADWLITPERLCTTAFWEIGYGDSE